ncbi:MAG: hypothetical protein IKO61_07525 [Lachnospiraceae bacterium]|nr:hypothetical protein [Lachnospiraceae bacterium]
MKQNKKIIACFLAIIITILTLQIMPASKAAAAPFTIKYRTYVQSYGWQDWMKNGVFSGTKGQSKRLEAIQIKLENAPVSGNVLYRTYVQSYGWQDWAKNGALSGTRGESKRLEAIQVKLSGMLSEKYDIYYRVYAQSYGWLGWAKNGYPAGTSGYSKRLEGIQICLVKAGGKAPGNTSNPYVVKSKNYIAYSFRNSNLLNQHYDKHGKEMGFASAQKYEAAASNVINNSKALHKKEADDGDDVYYLEATNEFAVLSTDGYIRTYFQPDSGIDYFNRQ